MLEVELTSELVIAGLDGMQDKKKSIDSFYAQYDEEFKERAQVQKRFRAVIDEINQCVGDSLEELEFSRPPLFYTLYCVLFHRLFGLPKERAATPKKPLGESDRRALGDAVRELSDIITKAKQEVSVPKQFNEFITACLRQTDNIQPRKTRFITLYKAAF
jgi:hypothetical protein